MVMISENRQRLLLLNSKVEVFAARLLAGVILLDIETCRITTAIEHREGSEKIFQMSQLNGQFSGEIDRMFMYFVWQMTRQVNGDRAGKCEIQMREYIYSWVKGTFLRGIGKWKDVESRTRSCGMKSFRMMRLNLKCLTSKIL